VRGLNLAVALAVHIVVGVVGLGWTVFEGSTGEGGALLLAVSWIAGAIAMAAWRETHRGRLWLVPAIWALAVLELVLGLVVGAVAVLIWLFAKPAQDRPPSARTRVGVSAPADDVQERLALLERRLDAFVNELAALKRDVATRSRRPTVQAEEPAPAPTPPSAPVPPPPPPPRPESKPEPERDDIWSRPFTIPISWSDLTGARALAWTGGIVTLLGIVFFFVLAVNRGWVSPELRLILGAAASVAVFGTGVWVRMRYGQLYSPLAAVGAGIAGGFATLLAATALYEFVPEVGALAAAAGIAAVAVVTALAWSSETIAALGLIGALLVPLMVLFEEEELSLTGTGFAGIVFAATAIVAISRGWRALLVAGGLASFAQIAVVVAQTDKTEWTVVGLATAFWLLYLATGVAHHLVLARDRLHALTAGFVFAGAVLAGVSAAHLFGEGSFGLDREGAAFLVLAAVHGALGTYFFRSDRDLSSLLWAAGLVLAAVAGAELVSGLSLTVVWAAEAAALAWLVSRTKETRFQVAGLVYLVLAAGYAVGWEAPPSEFLDANRHPAEGAPSVAILALGALLLARYARRPVEIPRTPLGRVLTAVEQAVYDARLGYLAAAGLFAVYAASLGILELSEWIRIDSVEARFERGHIFVTILWALVALALLEVGERVRHVRPMELVGVAWLATTLAKTVGYDGSELSDARRSYAFLAVAAAALLIGFEYQRLDERLRRLSLIALGCVVVSFVLAFTAVVELVDGDWNGIDLQGAALLALAAVYAGFAAIVFSAARHRDLSTLLWVPAGVLVAVACAELLDEAYLTLAWSAVAIALAALAVVAKERRFYLSALAFLALALGNALVIEAPPAELFSTNRHPGEGVPSLMFACLAALALAVLLRPQRGLEPRRIRSDLTWPEIEREIVARVPLWRALALLTAGIVALYAASLAILELFQWALSASVATDFQRGHTAVSALWGLVGLALLYVGLARRSRVFRLAGFALFAVSLAKLFLYDLSYLSSLARAFSFLAVGAVLLLGGFFYQRLSQQLDDRRPNQSAKES
jgi:uncharacterized membrane protein